VPGALFPCAGLTAPRGESDPVARLPENLDRRTNVDLHRRNLEPWIRRGVLLLFTAISVAGLANLFGQEPRAATVVGDAADVTLEAPGAVRGGLIYQVTVRVAAHRDLAEPALVFDPGWFEGLTVNTFEPEPVEWRHRDGRSLLVYGPVEAEDELVVRLQYQVNPTALGRRAQNLELVDEGEPLVRVEHDATIYP
jgi:hypothetical protein